jgi:hypothetical protein
MVGDTSGRGATHRLVVARPNSNNNIVDAPVDGACSVALAVKVEREIVFGARFAA